MFKNMRRKDRMVEAQECSDILMKAEFGTLATIGENGYPYSIPLSYCYIDDVLYFHCAGTGKKLDDIEYNSKVSFSVVGSTNVIQEKFTTTFESVILFGTAEIATGEDKERGLLGLVEKYSPDFYEAGKQYIAKAVDHTTVVMIKVDHITGKASR